MGILIAAAAGGVASRLLAPDPVESLVKMVVPAALAPSSGRPFMISPDGRRAAVVLSAGGNRDIWIIDLEDGSRTRLTFTPQDEDEPAWSPDGRYLANGGDERGQIGVRIVPIDGKEGKWEIGSGDLEGWPAAGRELFYRDEAELIAVPVQTDPARVLGHRERLFKYERSWSSLSVSSDGKRFLVLQPTGKEPAPSGIVVVQNWASEFSGDRR